VFARARRYLTRGTQLAACRKGQELAQIPVDDVREDLRFGITETHIDLDQCGGSVRDQHEIGEQGAAEGRACRLHSSADPLEDRALDVFQKPGSGQRHRAIRTHSTRVGSGVLFPQALVVLDEGQQPGVLAVTDGVGAHLGAKKPLFQHDGAPGIPEGTPAQHLARGLRGLLVRLRDDHALARAQAVRLDHRRRRKIRQRSC
jgi:hypothetical protein